MEYKNELLRPIKLYQPDLATVPTEFQRQAVARFEGLDDVKLKRKLRRHCKRGKLDIEEAFNYAVDSETSDLQTTLRDGDVAAAFHQKTFASTVLNLSDAEPNVAMLMGIQEEMQRLSTKQQRTKLQIGELAAAMASNDDRLTLVSEGKWGCNEYRAKGLLFQRRFQSLDLSNFAQRQQSSDLGIGLNEPDS